ncbi:alginate export family protein [Pedobacter kyonggii]|uniref:Alginate export domain-containing protein n=1 Tax=Pedobacter kyonggii TaxID=1926871 RepID=A0A4Q9HH50_9SPHI|nr:alginate export family protein [Pedobacter kyonggii]TBO44445.1 hypothetical protein EYS08_03830 [Pedobacter kyonggii]
MEKDKNHSLHKNMKKSKNPINHRKLAPELKGTASTKPIAGARNGLFSCHVSLSLRLLFFLMSYCSPGVIRAQVLDSVNTGPLPDAAEEFWPRASGGRDTLRWYGKIKHMGINHGRGSVGIGVSLREGYEFFDNYLWGIGPQDDNGFHQHRGLVTADVRWNRTLRVFSEVQSGFISGRNGGARPVQDLNKLVVNQLFAEITVFKAAYGIGSLRVGKQALNYGVGSLLDVRDINVRRTFLGYKLVLKGTDWRLDAFYMNPLDIRDGFFDDRVNRRERIAGLWHTIFSPGKWKPLRRLDLYYLYFSSDFSQYNKVAGEEKRSTVGFLSELHGGNWTNFLGADLQFGKLADQRIRSWKLMGTVNYSFGHVPLKPTLGGQMAISSGDKSPDDNQMQTFNPIYPKGLYYGFVDNAGSVNLIIFHPKCDFRISARTTLSLNYYRFWRARASDGLYSTPGRFLLAPNNPSRSVGWMGDIVAGHAINSHLSFSAVTSYYKRGAFLRATPSTPGDIFYFGIRSALSF